MAAPPINDFYKKKVKFYFNEILDFDYDGKISTRDIDTFKEMYKQMKNLKQTSPELESFSKFLHKWIGTILTYSNKNDTTDSIFIDDFHKYCEKVRQELFGKKTWPASLSYMSDYIDALFNILDIDNDGFISRTDFLSNYASAEDLKSREASWEILTNKDNSKKIDKKTFNELCIEFLVSTDPKDKGNWIFGVFTY